MAGTAYNRYRLYITRSRDDLTYFSVEELELYESIDSSTENLSIGATATSSSNQSSSFLPKNAIDGKLNTCWESASSADPQWLMITLPSAKLVRSFKMKVVTYPGEAPRDFILQGSNDGVNWDNLHVEVGNLELSITRKISISVSGVSKLSTGVRSSYVIVSIWNTGQLVQKITPNSDGSWVCKLSSYDDVLVTHIGPSGYQPKSDGPITPYSW